MESQNKYQFSADIKQLMDLIVNAFYSKKEIFLRELISNASDAIDKIKYQSLTNSELLGDNQEFEIKITQDKENNQFIIQDTGIGMTKEELISNLGTIASSGTKKFIESLGENKDTSMIGQFGVGFYSAYLVADRVEVITKHTEDKQYKWSSDANGSYTIDEDASESIGRGTKIILHLKESEKEYLEESKVEELVKKHSQYISFPIKLWTTVEEEVTDDEEEKADEVTDEVKVEDVDESEAKPEKKMKKVTRQEWKILNQQKPIWCRKPDDVTDEEHKEFYKSISNDWNDYATKKHFSVEGGTNFTSLLYVPKKPPFDMFGGQNKVVNKIKLYVRRVFIMDNCKDLMPEYLSFVVGIVDSQDLPLNVSREMIQHDKSLGVIKKQLVKKIVDGLLDFADADEKEYMSFYDEFSKNIKLGVYEDEKNRSKLCKLLRFHTTQSGNDKVSLDTYLKSMPEDQKNIYFLSGENLESIKDSPFLEALQKKNYNVLLMTEAIDEYMVQQLKEYEGKQLVDVSKEDLDLGQTEEEKEEIKTKEKDFESFTKYVKKILGDEVSKVVLTTRTVDTPCILSSSKGTWNANMQRIMKSQPLGNNMMHQFMMGQKILEINPNNKTIMALRSKYTQEPSDTTVKDLVWLLYETAMINSGFQLKNTSSHAKRINRLISFGLDVEDDDDDEDDDVPELNTVVPESNEIDDEVDDMESLD